jgi:hypothetical protein
VTRKAPLKRAFVRSLGTQRCQAPEIDDPLYPSGFCRCSEREGRLTVDAFEVLSADQRVHQVVGDVYLIEDPLEAFRISQVSAPHLYL